MQLISQFVLRNADAFAGSAGLLWLDPPGDAPWQALASRVGRLQLGCTEHGDWQRLRAAGADPSFTPFPEPAPATDTVLLSLPREKDRLRMLARAVAAALPPTGRLWVAGENQAGVRSCAGQLEGVFAAVVKRDSARHCALYEAGPPLPGTRFEADAWRRDWRCEHAGFSFAVRSWPGVFAHGELDPGTALLLEHLPLPSPGARVLDFACGAGVLGAALLQRQPGLELVMADASAIALHASQATLDANRMAATLCASDGLAEVPGRFGLVVSNPPFHRRHATQQDLGMRLLQQVREKLSPGGRLLLVANRHLGWPRWLEGQFGHCQVLAARDGYHVLSAVEPARGRAVHAAPKSPFPKENQR